MTEANTLELYDEVSGVIATIMVNKSADIVVRRIGFAFVIEYHENGQFCHSLEEVWGDKVQALGLAMEYSL